MRDLKAAHIEREQRERFITMLELAKADLELSSSYYRHCSVVTLTKAALFRVTVELLEAIETGEGV